jgi:hypothetical protein
LQGNSTAVDEQGNALLGVVLDPIGTAVSSEFTISSDILIGRVAANLPHPPRSLIVIGIRE